MTGSGCPLTLLTRIMIQKEQIEAIIADFLKANDLFLVDITISKENDIEVTIDSMEKAVTLDHCIAINKVIEGALNREIEDYSLTVSSAGLDQPFKVLDQYRKFTGSEVEVVLKKGGKVKGILSDCLTEKIEITTSKMVKKEGAKKKTQEDTVTAYSFEEIKSCKPVIKFK